ncbi:MAG: hypothetical protein DHS20C21_20290 [Gemmatimonadota bacterium]|nr:MAG: hypothetical protein DHS20C21_20290 [Gemmatimonadota bacterium]
MAKVQFTRHLRLHFPALADVQVAGADLAELVAGLDALHPGLAGYLIDDRGSLRMHVNIFINGEILQDRTRLTDPVSADDEVFVMQALSGG